MQSVAKVRFLNLSEKVQKILLLLISLHPSGVQACYSMFNIYLCNVSAGNKAFIKKGQFIHFVKFVLKKGTFYLYFYLFSCDLNIFQKCNDLSGYVRLCQCMFVYCVSNITENTKRASKYICAKFIYVSDRDSASLNTR